MSDKQNLSAEKTAKTIVLTGFGGYDKLKIENRPWPTAEKGKVVIDVKACGLNFAELMARQGMYDFSMKTPCVLGLEGSGVVSEVGEDVDHVKVGDRVVMMNSFGLWTEAAVVAGDRVFKIPDEMTFEEAAAIPVNYITAYQMLFDFGNLRKGKSVLVHMAAGGVGVAATQLCKTVEDVTIFGTASQPKHEFLKKSGVNYPIDYRTQDYVEEIRKISPTGVDIVLDPLSGNDSVKGFNLLKPMGKIIHFGAANAVTGEKRSLMAAFKMWWGTTSHTGLGLMSQNKAVCGYHLGKLVHAPELIREATVDLIKMFKDGKIKPKIDSVWAFEDVGKAMAQMHDRKNIGKVILTPHKSTETKD